MNNFIEWLFGNEEEQEETTDILFKVLVALQIIIPIELIGGCLLFGSMGL